MGTTKTDLFTALDNEIALMAKAFSNPARVAILQHLLKTNACVNSDLVQELGLAQATISQHLKELKNIGIIQGTIEGSRISYCINPARWIEVKNQFLKMLNQYQPPSNKECC